VEQLCLQDCSAIKMLSYRPKIVQQRSTAPSYTHLIQTRAALAALLFIYSFINLIVNCNRAVQIAIIDGFFNNTCDFSPFRVIGELKLAGFYRSF
ncbi:MAG: hypothetical protein CL586_08065, partial [Alteromonadaceae bacterium]|nr:hypothetical protein [Alteromonadaceae bacterium]